MKTKILIILLISLSFATSVWAKNFNFNCGNGDYIIALEDVEYVAPHPSKNQYYNILIVKNWRTKEEIEINCTSISKMESLIKRWKIIDSELR